MAFDFDSLSYLDLDADGLVTEQDINHYGLANGEMFYAMEVSQDMLFDRHSLDFNGNMIVDRYESDFNQNQVIDTIEFKHINTTMNYDLNIDGRIDEIDAALATVLFQK